MELDRVDALYSSVALIRAEHSVTPGYYANVSAARFRGLDPRMYLAVGARVFITSNLWMPAGLVNLTALPGQHYCTWTGPAVPTELRPPGRQASHWWSI